MSMKAKCCYFGFSCMHNASYTTCKLGRKLRNFFWGEGGGKIGDKSPPPPPPLLDRTLVIHIYNSFLCRILFTTKAPLTSIQIGNSQRTSLLNYRQYCQAEHI